ncbi:MAG: hypothetical protein A3G39_10905 [Deltaproteobacteria bacterium RIFCSPLOWO2_12_FULL_43_16]|nr:MAG: hypothetical protein A2Z89_07455 [Deltaproteobacteria bacterium GWA2_43_19]OGQ61148.1 MAG: hypothetical protein A3G39_10905 [Deltaproteobacteria bacterium RIFCSPLOWO2_12_FULL_43_16]HBR17098.1 hypothetical protein [Deltaproteobacteria bacterium]
MDSPHFFCYKHKICANDSNADGTVKSSRCKAEQGFKRGILGTDFKSVPKLSEEAEATTPQMDFLQSRD